MKEITQTPTIRRSDPDLTQTRFMDETSEKIDHAYIVERSKMYASYMMSLCDPSNPDDVIKVYTAMQSFEALMAYKTELSPRFQIFNREFLTIVPNIQAAFALATSTDKKRFYLFELIKQKFERLVLLQKDTLSYGFEVVTDYIYPSRKYKSITIEALQKDIFEDQKNAIVLVVGNVGTGKSYISMGMAQNFDPTFDNSRVAHKTGQEFIHVVKNTMDKFGDGGQGRGKAIVWDDAGKGLKSEERWQFIFQRVQDVFQTFRIEGYLIFINCPDEGLITKRMENFINYIIYTENTIDKKNQYAWAKIYKYEKNRLSQKVYKKFVMLHNKEYLNMKPKKIDYIAIKRIGKILEKGYLDDKIRTNKAIVDDTIEELNLMEINKKRSEMSLSDIIEDAKKHVDKFIGIYNKRKFIDNNKIRAFYLDDNGNMMLSDRKVRVVQAQLKDMVK